MSRVPRSHQLGCPPPPPSYSALFPEQNITLSETASVLSTSTQGIPIQFEHDPQSMKCPLCRKHIVTHVEYEVGNETCYGALILTFCGCFCGCCLLPFCLTECQDAVHSCPECRVIIGRQGSM